jgi:LPXTG-site transpeptidase (sortase) family protein
MAALGEMVYIGRKRMAKKNFIALLIGITLMAFGAAASWIEYQSTHNPLDEPAGAGLSSGWFSLLTNLFHPAPVQPAPESVWLGTVPALTPTETVIPPGFAGIADALPNLPGAQGMGQNRESVGTPTVHPRGLVPDRLVIPAFKLDAPILPVRYRALSFDDQMYDQWLAPDKFAVGWSDTSALLGYPGNSVFDGHHNSFGMVFKDLVNLNIGDEIDIYSGNVLFQYRVVLKMLVPERMQPMAVRMANARWIAPTTDERITLITCWPANDSTHRVIIVAYPIQNK